MSNEAYYSREHFQQQRRMLANGDPRALICFCIDVSQSMDEWWIQEGGLSRTTGSAFSDGHQVQHFNLKDIRPGYAHYQKIAKLNETLVSLLKGMKADRELCRQVAISIVTYSRQAQVRYDFLDCEDVDIERCKVAVDRAETNMGDAIRTSLAQIDEMREEMAAANNDHYTPILVFMTDGTPTDNPREELASVRRRVQDEDLFVFPLGIGDGANMTMLQDMFPEGHIPPQYTSRYKMVQPRDYQTVFEDIRNHVRRKLYVMVSEGDSIQSAPATEEVGVDSTQTGQSILDLFEGAGWI